ncbi:carboxypeptidase [Endozoicomonas sp. SM1973]|uniref:Carboxypeptidase n=1 Tax=Spartinivicinus marinus TaxID=2994442 RepID=A0A853IDH9_9GAMM|nr:M14 family zinc carboxypeptidase [Spartinivicinus marinus]MCX4025919.1 M14 family zinc carboxypeptidase [Spartinivicinus marinus]NYZ68104.1 carboxypeptidase [Spartinivicinus marinus]
MFKNTLTSLIGVTLGIIALPTAATNNEHNSEAIIFIDQEQAALSTIYKVTFDSEEIYNKAKISFHGQMLESHDKSFSLILDLSQEEKQRLIDTAKQQGFKADIKKATQWIKKRNRELEQIKEKMQQPSLSLRSGLDENAGGIPGFQCYETVEETFTEAQQIANKFSNIAQWLDVGNSWKKEHPDNSSQGYDIKVLKLTNTAIKGDKPKLFLNSGLHAREYATAPLALEFARHLTNNYGKDADITWILDHHEVHFMLHSNPDGRKIAENRLTKFQRKNANFTDSGGSCRPVYKNGIDLNRNFSHNWEDNITGASDNACDDTYRGLSEASELETQAIQSYMRTIWEDNRAPNRTDKAPLNTKGIFIDIHSHGGLVLWPWGDSSQTAPNSKELQTLGRRFAWFNQYSPKQASGLYPTTGASDDFAYGELGVAAFTFELGKSGTFFEPCESFNKTVKPDNLKALLYAAKVARTPYMTPSGPETLELSLNSGNSEVEPGTQVRLTARATDANFNHSNGRERTQRITEAQYSIDTPFWTAGHTSAPLEVTGRQGNITGTIDTTGLEPGRHIVYVRTKDSSGQWGPVSAQFLQIKEGNTTPDDDNGDNNDNGQYIYQDRKAYGIKTGKYEFSKGLDIPQNAPNSKSAIVRLTVKHRDHSKLRIALVSQATRAGYFIMRNDGDSSDGIQKTYTSTIPANVFNNLKGKNWQLAFKDTSNNSDPITGIIIGWSIQFSR